jgi:hypoxanthine-DNA glycosylase
VIYSRAGRQKSSAINSERKRQRIVPKETRIYSYGPVADEKSRVLVLGTIASPMSLLTGFFYGHPRNSFWTILSRFFGEPLPLTNDEKRSLLLRNRVALWDVIHSCVRPGALDADITKPEPNDIAGFLKSHTGIRAVLLNGGKAYELYVKNFGKSVPLPAHKMPSTSPAYASLSVHEKFERWADILNMYL